MCLKVAAARKFSAEKYVNDYLEDFHKDLLPKTYQGHRLPEWLIKVTSDCATRFYEIISLQELMEKDREDAKEKAMQGKEVTFEFWIFNENHFAGHHRGKDCRGWGDCRSVYQESVEVNLIFTQPFAPTDDLYLFRKRG